MGAFGVPLLVSRRLQVQVTVRTSAAVAKIEITFGALRKPTVQTNLVIQEPQKGSSGNLPIVVQGVSAFQAWGRAVVLPPSKEF